MHKNIFIKIVFYWSLYCLLLIGLRFLISHSILNVFLAWNLLLAWMPLIFLYLSQKVEKLKYLFIFLWFIFLPNGFYLITDLKHLWPNASFLLYWLDVMTFFSTAFIGTLLGVISLQEMKKSLNKTNEKVSRFVIGLSLLLSGYGIYLGRFPRINSWHIFTQPITTIQIILDITKNIFLSTERLAFVFIFTLSFFIFYYGYKKIDEYVYPEIRN